MLPTGIGIGIVIGSGQYYWILGIGWLSWYRSNPNKIASYEVIMWYSCY